MRELRQVRTEARYTDIAVSAGKSYFYVVTAVEGNGTESTYSSQAMAVIP